MHTPRGPSNFDWEEYFFCNLEQNCSEVAEKDAYLLWPKGLWQYGGPWDKAQDVGLFFYHSESHNTLKIQTNKNLFERDRTRISWELEVISYQELKTFIWIYRMFKGELNSNILEVNGGAKLVLNSMTPLDRTIANEWNFRLYLRRTFRRVPK